MSPKRKAPRTILVPLDGSPFAERALPLALAVAGRSGAALRLALVHQPPPVPAMPDTARSFVDLEPAARKAERDYLRGVATRLGKTLGRTVRSVQLEGEVAGALREHALDVEADLVIMTTHGRGPIRRAWLGSVADRLVRTLDIPMLIVPPPGPSAGAADGQPSIGRALVALDGSRLAEAALEPATTLARLFGAELELVQVVPPVVLLAEPPLALPTEADAELGAIRQAAAQEYVNDVARRLQDHGVAASASAVRGPSVPGTLLDLSRSAGVDLIALATHGRRGLPRMMLGSVADKLVRAAEVPVLVCRPGKG